MDQKLPQVPTPPLKAWYPTSWGPIWSNWTPGALEPRSLWSRCRTRRFMALGVVPFLYHGHHNCNGFLQMVIFSVYRQQESICRFVTPRWFVDVSLKKIEKSGARSSMAQDGPGVIFRQGRGPGAMKKNPDAFRYSRGLTSSSVKDLFGTKDE